MWSTWAEILNRVVMRDRRPDGHGVFQLPCFLQESHLEGQRDFVSRLITPMAHIISLVILLLTYWEPKIVYGVLAAGSWAMAHGCAPQARHND